MRWLVAFLILLATVLRVSAEDWTTVDGKSYTNVIVVQADTDGVNINFDGGSAKIPYYNLPLALQKKFGQDPDSLAAARTAAYKEAADRATAAQEAKKRQEQMQKQLADDEVHIKALAAARAALHPGQVPTAPTVAAAKSAFSGAQYSYNKIQDVCYLDSLPANASPLPAPAVPDPLAGQSSLTLRIETDGPVPEHTDKIIATILSVSPVRKLADTGDIIFLVDGTVISISESDKKDSDFASVAGQIVEHISFYLTPDQAKSIVNGKSVKFCVGNNNYTLDSDGVPQLQQYLVTLDKLSPPSSNLIRHINALIRKLPTLPDLISQTCVDIVIGAFVILVFVGIASFFATVGKLFKG